MRVEAAWEMKPMVETLILLTRLGLFLFPAGSPVCHSLHPPFIGFTPCMTLGGCFGKPGVPAKGYEGCQEGERGVGQRAVIFLMSS